MIKLTTDVEILQKLAALQLKLPGEHKGVVHTALAAHAYERAIEEREYGSRLIDGVTALRDVRKRAAAILAELLKEAK